MLKSGRVRAGLVYRSDRRRCALAQYAGCSIGYFASELSGGRVVDGGRSFPPPLTIITFLCCVFAKSFVLRSAVEKNRLER